LEAQFIASRAFACIPIVEIPLIRRFLVAWRPRSSVVHSKPDLLDIQ